jgi:hypothetical protein
MIDVSRELQSLLAASKSLALHRTPTGHWDTADVLYAAFCVLFGGCLLGVAGGGIAALVGMGVIAALAVGSNRLRLRIERRRVLRPVDPPKLLLPPREEVGGVVERLDGIVESPLTRTPCVAATLVVRRENDPGVLLWHTLHAPRFLLVDEGRRTAVSGPIWIEGHPDATGPGETWLPTAGLAHGKTIAEERRIDVGARIVVRGTASSELLAGVSYREAEIPVIRAANGRAPIHVRCT